MGKWQSVCDVIPGPDAYPALTRHPWDLGTMSVTLAGIAQSPLPELAEMIGDLRGPIVSAGLRSLHNPAWQAAFDDYAEAMATRPIAGFLYSYADPRGAR